MSTLPDWQASRRVSFLLFLVVWERESIPIFIGKRLPSGRAGC